MTSNLSPEDLVHGGFYQYISKNDNARFLLQADLVKAVFHLVGKINVSEADADVNVVDEYDVNACTIPINQYNVCYGIAITPSFLINNGFRQKFERNFTYMDKFELHQYSGHLYFASYGSQPTSEAFFCVHELQRALHSRRMFLNAKFKTNIL